MKEENVENQRIDQEFFDYLCNGYRDLHPMTRTLGIKTVYMGKGTAGLKMSPEPQYSSANGRVHGGIISTLADTAMGRAAATATGWVCRTVEMNLNYLAPAFEETEISAEGFVIHAGNTIIVTGCNVYNCDGKLMANSRGTYIRDRKHQLHPAK
ncbi:MAG: PaaI family thioesterase [Syntrophomonadaceae bacterium]|nr:PaaI family thioesterase [Syntrophomonadaceae bacterium]